MLGPPLEGERVYAFGAYTLAVLGRELRRSGEFVPLEPKAFDLVTYLIEHRDRVVSKRELFDALWRDVVVTDGVLNQCVWSARRAVGDGHGRQDVIKTFHRRGYRFVADVSLVNPVERQDDERPTVEGKHPLGRSGEIGRLAALLSETPRGTTRWCLVSGEAGIGKTTLLNELTARALARGVGVAVGRCYGAGQARAFGPWIQVARQVANMFSDGELADCLGDEATDVVALIPELASRLKIRSSPLPVDVEQARLRLFESLALWFTRSSERRSLLLVLEDLHEADGPSLVFFEFLVRGTSAAHLLVASSFRTVDVRHKLPPKLIELAAAPEGVHVALTGLAAGCVRQLAERAGGRTFDESEIALINQRSNGNPFFVEEIARWITRHRRREDPTSLLKEVPDSIREIMRSRLASASARSRELVEVAAVLGCPFSLATLSTIFDAGPEELSEILVDATMAHLLVACVDGREFNFTHDLIRDSIYQAMSPARRAELHGRVARALERRWMLSGRNTSEVASHYARALPIGSPRKAFEFNRRAGEEAVRAMAHEQAIAFFESALRALELCEDLDDARALELLLAMGRTQLRAGHREDAQTTLTRAADLARRTNRSESLARVAIELVPGILAVAAGVTDPVVVGVLEDALTLVSKDHAAEHALLLAHLAIATYWSWPRAKRRDLCEQASRIAALVDDPRIRRKVRAACIAALWGPDDLDTRIRETEDLAQEAELAGEGELALEQRFLHVAALLEAGDLPRALAQTSVFDSLADELRIPAALWYPTRFRAMRASMLGDFEEAERLGTSFLEVGRRFDPVTAWQGFTSQRAIVYRLQGRLHELIPELTREMPARTVKAWRFAEPFILAELGDTSRARQVLDRLVTQELREIPPDAHWLTTIGLLADACIALGDPTHACALYTELEPYESSFMAAYGVTYNGSVARLLGGLAALLGDWSKATTHYTRAVTFEERVGSRPFAVLARVEWAAALRRSGRDLAQAEALARTALDMARELGMQHAVEQASTLCALVTSSDPS